MSYRQTAMDILLGKYPIEYRDYAKLSKDVSVHKTTMELMGRERLKKVSFGGRCIVGSGVTIGEGVEIENSVIGDNTYIGDGAAIKGVTTLMPFAQVERECSLSNCIVGGNTRVGSRSVVFAGAVLGEGLLMPKNSLVGVDMRVAKSVYRKRIENARDPKGRPLYRTVEEVDGRLVFTR